MLFCQGNKEFVFSAVKLDGLAFRYASSVLKKDNEIILEALKNKKI